jgi:hypothetical protein
LRGVSKDGREHTPFCHPSRLAAQGRRPPQDDGGVCGRMLSLFHFPRAWASKALSTASVMALTPVSMVGFGTGANSGE